MDAYFPSENNAQRLVDFLKGNYPTQIKSSKQLISHDERNNTANVKITFVVTLPIICREDLVLVYPKLAKELGGCCRVLLCTKVKSGLHMLDVNNFKKIIISTNQYFLYEDKFEIFPLKVYGKKFNVLDYEEKEK